jgi:AraC family transcriptional regulator
MHDMAPHLTEGRDLQRRAQVVRLARVIKVMLATLDAPLDLPRLARIACVSRFHFVRQFRALTGEAPQRFHLKLRLQRAAWSLIAGDDSIADIAIAAGFESADGFGRAFNRVYRIAPTDFRRLRADPWSSFSRFGHWRPSRFAPHSPPTGVPFMHDLRQLPAMTYAGVRNVGPYNTVGAAFERIVGWAASRGLMTAETKCLGLSWDDPSVVPADKLRYDAAITIDGRIETPDDIEIGALPAMTWAMATHIGSYARMTESFMQLESEIRRRADLVHVPLCCLEIYLNGPGTPEPELRTEIGYPVVSI